MLDLKIGCEKCKPGTPGRFGLGKFSATDAAGNQVVQECECMIRYRASRALGSLARVDPLYGLLWDAEKKTSLWRTEHGLKSLFLRGEREIAIRHLGGYLTKVWAYNDQRAKKLLVRFVTDHQLVEAHFGRYIPTDSREPKFDSEHQMIAGVHVLIIHLGSRFKNKLAPDILLNVLRPRVEEQLPVILVEGDTRFTANHAAYSVEVKNLIDSDFVTLEVGGVPAIDPEPPKPKPEWKREPDWKPGGKKRKPMNEMFDGEDE